MVAPTEARFAINGLAGEAVNAARQGTTAVAGAATYLQFRAENEIAERVGKDNCTALKLSGRGTAQAPSTVAMGEGDPKGISLENDW